MKKKRGWLHHVRLSLRNTELQVDTMWLARDFAVAWDAASNPWHLNWSTVESIRRLAMKRTDLPWLHTNATCGAAAVVVV
jgi:hypothetical protein